MQNRPVDRRFFIIIIIIIIIITKTTVFVVDNNNDVEDFLSWMKMNNHLDDLKVIL